MKTKNRSAFTLLELILTVGGIAALGALLIFLVITIVGPRKQGSPPPTPTNASVSIMPEASAATLEQPSAPAAPVVAPVAPVAAAPASQWGYIPEDGHTGFWIWGLFFPRLTVLFTYYCDQLPHSSISYWGKWWMALLIPRILYIIYLAQNGLQQSLWMILHIIALVLVWGGGIVNRSSKS